MKPLDEVIDGITKQSGLEIRNVRKPEKDRFWVDRETYMDALQYLRWYKELADDSEAFAKWKENPPLTWDELRTMDGKPVWVEQCNGDTKGWLLILRTNYDVINCTTKHGNSFYLYKSSYGEKWQAYRKENKCTRI